MPCERCEKLEKALRGMTRLRLMVEAYEGRVFDKPEMLRLLDAADKALRPAEEKTSE